MIQPAVAQAAWVSNGTSEMGGFAAMFTGGSFWATRGAAEREPADKHKGTCVCWRELIRARWQTVFGQWHFNQASSADESFCFFLLTLQPF